MTIANRGPFDFVTKGIKYIVGFIRSRDGVIIEPANCFVDAGDHINSIDSTHAYTHKGHTYMSGHSNTSVADNTSISLLLVTGALYDAHMTYEITAGGDVYVDVFENTTTSNNGTAITSFIKTRGIVGGDAATNVVVTHTPTVTNDGTSLGPQWFVPGGTRQLASGAGSNTREEWVLKPSTKYLIRVTNMSGAAKFIGIRATWYDHASISSKDSV